MFNAKHVVVFRNKGYIVKNTTPRQILLSKRANVFYIEHARVIQKNDRIVYLTDTGDRVDYYFNIPDRNTAFLLLGKGTSITDAAARKLSESNVLVGFCGSGGSPLFSAIDQVFLTPQSEYRPTEYMQKWIQLWGDDTARLGAAKLLLQQRIIWTRDFWGKNENLRLLGIDFSTLGMRRFLDEIKRSESTQSLLLSEARWAKKIYATLADGTKMNGFVREAGKGASESLSDVINGFIDHGNYIAYGYAAVVLNGMGISFSLPLLHGKTRRGALVFDIADLIKDAIVLPAAFVAGKRRMAPEGFRARLIEACQKNEILDLLFGFISSLLKEDK